MDYFAADLIDDVRDRAMLPESDTTLSDVSILRILNSELRSYVAELLISSREDYLLQSVDVALQFTAYGSTTHIRGWCRLPNAEVVSGARLVTLVSSSSGQDIETPPLVRLGPGQNASGAGLAYSIEADALIVLGDAAGYDSVRIRYHHVPELVEEAQSMVLSAPPTTTSGHFTVVGAPPAGWVDGMFVDCQRSGGSHMVTGQSLLTVDVDTGDIELSQPAPLVVLSLIEAGDFVVRAGTCVVPPIPPGLMPLLCQRAAYVALRALGDPKAAAAREQLDEMRSQTIRLLQPRTEGSPRYVVSAYAPGIRNRFGRGRHF